MEIKPNYLKNVLIIISILSYIYFFKNNNDKGILKFIYPLAPVLFIGFLVYLFLPLIVDTFKDIINKNENSLLKIGKAI